MRAKDAEVITAFLAGERVAVKTIDTWIRQAASPYRRRLADAWEDVLQDLHLELTRLLRKEQFQGRSSLKTYLYRVVSHACLNHIRSAEKWQWTELDDAELGSGESAAYQMRDGNLESKDLLLRVWQAMSPQCRGLWSMIFEGRSYQEMSQRLGVSQGTLRVRVLRCRKKAEEFRRQNLEVEERRR